MVYRPEIDGLRAVAVLSVILFHAGVPIFNGGYLGVDIFFVISGYLITGILLKELKLGNLSIINFYERRARRILPALTVIIITSTIFSWFLMTPSEFKLFSESVGTSAIFVSNFLFLAEVGYFSPDIDIQPLVHLWSLAVEEQFYLIFPLALWLVFRIGHIALSWVLVIALLGVSAFICYSFAPDYPDKIFFFSPARFWEILTGSVVALLLFGRSPWSNQVLSGIGLLAIFGAMFVNDVRTPFPSIHTVLAVGGTALILAFGGRGSAVARILTMKPCVGIGLISYSAYLWHQPLFAFARMRTMSEPSWLVMLALILFTFSLAFLTWKWVEKPFRFRSHPYYPTRKAVAFSFGVLTVVMFLFGVIGSITKGLPARLPEHVQKLSMAAHSDSNPYDYICQLELIENDHPLPGCLDYLVDGEIDVIFLGDSHSGAISYEAQNELLARGIGSYAVSSPGCPGLPGFEGAGAASLGRCNNYAINILNFARRKSINTLVITSRFPMSYHGVGFDNGEGGIERKRGGDDYRSETIPIIELNDFNRKKRVLSGITEQLDSLSLEFNIVLIGAIPEAGWKVPAMLARRALRGSDGLLSTSYDAYISRTKEINDAFDAVKNANLHKIDMSNVFCDLQLPGRCINELDGLSLYSDDDHLSNAGARLLAPKIADIVQTIMSNNVSN